MEFIKPFSEIPNDIWDDLVKESDDAWLYQTSRSINWQTLSSKNIKNLSFGIFSESNYLVACVPLFLVFEPISIPKIKFLNVIVRTINYASRMTFGYPLLARRLLKFDTESFSGPVIVNAVGKRGRSHLLRLIFREIDKLAFGFKAKQFEARLCEPARFNHPEYRPTINPLFYYGVTEPYGLPRGVVYTELNGTLSDIWKQLDEDCRSAVNKGKRSNLLFVENDNKNVERFHKIHAPSWDRTMGHHQPLSRFLNMRAHLDDGDNLYTFFAQKDGQDVATVMLHAYKDTIVYFGGASLDVAKKYSANNFLLYSTLVWAQGKGYKIFLVGLFEICETSENSKSYSVGKYKTQFSKRYYPAFESKKIY